MKSKIKKIVGCSLALTTISVNTMPIQAMESMERSNLNNDKETAINEINNYVNLAHYRYNEQQQVKNIISNATNGINNASSKIAINNYLSTAKSGIDKIKTDSQLTEEENKNESESNARKLENEKNSAKINLKKSVVISNYRRTELLKVNEIIENYSIYITNSTSINQVKQLLEEGKSKLTIIKTDSQLKAEENQSENQILSNKKSEAKAGLREYKNLNNYRTEQQNEINNILNSVSTLIDNAKNTSIINESVSIGKKKLDNVKTDSQLSKEEKTEENNSTSKTLSQSKTDAKKKVSQLVNLANYSKSVVAEMESTIASTNKNIDNSKTIEEVNKAVNECIIKLDSIKKNYNYDVTNNKNSNGKEPSSNVYSGSNIGNGYSLNDSVSGTTSSTVMTGGMVDSEGNPITETQNPNARMSEIKDTNAETTKDSGSDSSSNEVKTADMNKIRVFTVVGIIALLGSGIGFTKKLINPNKKNIDKK